MIRLTGRFAASLAFVAAVVASQRALADGLRLQLTDGSAVLAGEITAANEAALTLVGTGDGIRIERTLPWSRIAGADLAGQRYSRDELRLALGLPGDPAPLEQFHDWTPTSLESGGFLAAHHCCFGTPFGVRPFPPGRVIGVRPDPASAYADLAPAIYPNGIPSTEMPFALGVLRERRRLEAIGPFVNPAGFVPPFPSPPVPSSDSVPGELSQGELSQIEARVTPIRRGGSADINALGVRLIGFDETGRTVPVHGSAQISLYAASQRLVRAFDNIYAAKSLDLVRLAEWTRQVEADASLILRLPEPLPDHDPTISTIGSLRIRLNVPGIGVFNSLTEPVELRSSSTLRDALRAETGSRFLPDENTSGNRFQTWTHQRDFSSID